MSPHAAEEHVESSRSTMVGKEIYPKNAPFTRKLTQKGDDELTTALQTYLKMYVPGLILISVVILAVFSIFWGAFWKLPAHQFPGWVVVRLFIYFHGFFHLMVLFTGKDFDGGEIGQAVSEGLVASTASGTIEWRVVSPSQFEDGVQGVIRGVKEEHIWVAVVGMCTTEV